MPNYKEKRIEAIRNYFINNGGLNQDDLNEEYNYIFKKKKNNVLFNYDVDEEKNILKANKGREFKIDYRANNMTSSSMLSACFFAYYTENQDAFKRIINGCFGNTLDFNGEIKVITEYVDSKKNNKENNINGICDSTHFDALISFKANGKDYKIFVEVKYCEEKYGKKNYNKNEKLTEQENQKKYIDSCNSQFDIHSNRLKLDGYLPSEKEFEAYRDSDYSNYYQIIRMVSHASIEDNYYCMFLVPKGNEVAVNNINEGLEELKEIQENKNLINQLVFMLHFEDIIDKENELYKKYFK